MDHILGGIEKAVVENIKTIEVDLREVGRWCKELRIKHIGALSIFEDHLQKRNSLLSPLLHNPLVRQFLH